MFWKNLLKFLRGINRHKSLFLSILSVLFVFYFYSHKMDDSFKSVDEVKNKIEYMSWIFGGIMGLVSFLTLFIAFTYDNRLIEASKNLKGICKPYGKSVEDYRMILVDYEKSVTKGFTIIFIYWLVLLTSSVSIIVWGVNTVLYLNFSIKLPRLSDIHTVVDVCVVAIWVLLTTLFIGLTILTNLIKENKNPSEKGYLPLPTQLCDFDFISHQDSDLSEISRICCPKLEFCINPYSGSNHHDLSIFFPIKLTNMKFVIKIYNDNSNLILRCYGIIEKADSVGDKFFVSIDGNISVDLYNEIYQSAYAEIKFYNNKFESISRIIMQKNSIVNQSVSFIYERTITHIKENIDIDVNLFKNIGIGIINYQDDRINGFFEES